MEFTFMAQVNAAKEQVWEYYSDIEKWYEWERDLKNITLDHGFLTGSSGIMELEGMPPIHYTLTSVKEAEEFWDKTDTPMGSICFGHEIIGGSHAASVFVRHTVRLQGECASEEGLNFLKQIFSDVPDSVMLLKSKVENHG